MRGKSKQKNQRDLFRTVLIDFIDKRHELVLLSDKIDWSYFDNELSKFDSDRGRPSMPVRLMVGCLILKRLYSQVMKHWLNLG